MTTGATPGSRPHAIVTGGAGFVGSHLVDRLVADGMAVLVIDDLSSGNADNLPSEARLEQLDIATSNLGRPLRAWRPDIVYHLAAQASVPVSMTDPERDLAVNLIGTHRVTVAGIESGANRIVFVSSGGAIYGETEKPATEQTLPAPTSYYGVHKLAAEGHIAVSGMAYQIARPSNIYGHRQMAGLEGAVVAAFLDQATREGRLTIHGNGNQSRDLVHVLDVVDALVRLGTTTAPPAVWNVSTGRSVTVLELADVIGRELHRELGRVFGPRRAGDVLYSNLSSKRLREIGWAPSRDVTTGIRELLVHRGESSP